MTSSQVRKLLCPERARVTRVSSATVVIFECGMVLNNVCSTPLIRLLIIWQLDSPRENLNCWTGFGQRRRLVRCVRCISQKIDYWTDHWGVQSNVHCEMPTASSKCSSRRIVDMQLQTISTCSLAMSRLVFRSSLIEALLDVLSQVVFDNCKPAIQRNGLR